MDYNFLPSLQHSAVVIIASSFLHDYEIVNMMDEEGMLPRYTYFVNNETTKLIRAKMEKKFASLLPNSLGFTATTTIRHMYAELSRWKSDHAFLTKRGDNCFRLCIDCICWKTDGTINRRQTAKNFVVKGNIDAIVRFIMACTYFLEEDISALWEKIKEFPKKSITRKGMNSAVRFWMKWLKKEDIKNWTERVDEHFRIPCFKQSDIRLRLESFFQFLSCDSKLNYMMSEDFHKFHSDDFRLCSMKMAETERVKIFYSRSERALFCCLQWPFQSLFLNMAKELFGYLEVLSFKDFLYHLLTLQYCYDHELIQLFNEFWKMTPAILKDEVKKDVKYINRIGRFLKKQKFQDYNCNFLGVGSAANGM